MQRRELLVCIFTCALSVSIRHAHCTRTAGQTADLARNVLAVPALLRLVAGGYVKLGKRMFALPRFKIERTQRE